MRHPLKFRQIDNFPVLVDAAEVGAMQSREGLILLFVRGVDREFTVHQDDVTNVVAAVLGAGE